MRITTYIRMPKSYWNRLPGVNIRFSRPLALVAVISIGTLLGCAALAFVVRGYTKRTTPASVAASQPDAPDSSKSPPSFAPGQGQANERIETEIITVRPTGFDPEEVVRPHRRFLLAVDNRSGLDEINIVLERDTGNRLREVEAKVSRKTLDLRRLMNLPPGRYLLREADHPGWACRITITPN